MPRLTIAVALCLSGLSVLSLPARAQQPVDPNRWESTIQKFEAEDQAQPPAKGGVLFIGASSIARWTHLSESFPEVRTVNRGFGGSEMADSVKYARRVVVPHAPRIVVLYAGENDLNRGVSPEQVGADFEAFHDIISKDLPAARLVVIGLKPSPLRWKLRDGMHKTNALIKAHCERQRACTYVDPWPYMIGKDGTPKPELFVEDGLHLTPDGYKAWTEMLRPVLK